MCPLKSMHMLYMCLSALLDWDRCIQHLMGVFLWKLCRVATLAFATVEKPLPSLPLHTQTAFRGRQWQPQLGQCYRADNKCHWMLEKRGRMLLCISLLSLCFSYSCPEKNPCLSCFSSSFLFIYFSLAWEKKKKKTLEHPTDRTGKEKQG